MTGSRTIPLLTWHAALLVGLTGAAPLAGQAARPAAPLAPLERSWLLLRNMADELRMTRSRGLLVSSRGRSVDSLSAGVERARLEVVRRAAAVRPASLGPADRAAFDDMARILPSFGSAAADSSAQKPGPPNCTEPYHPTAGPNDTLAGLTDHVFACYGAAAQRIVVDHDTLDRLTIFGLLGRTDDRARRERLFRALMPVWQSVNGDDGARSPYREMVRRRVALWAQGPTPMDDRARGLGVAPDTLERWLLQVLEGWQATLPDTLLEPWDWYYRNGEASRRLSGAIPRDSLLPLNRRFYRALGVDPVALGTVYDIDPRPGKYPVAFTDIALRSPMTPWVSASYRIGGLDNLSELLHETGHAIHIAGIRTRPAWADWPDSDTFTEAIADLAALEMYEPGWQQRFLGVAAPLPVSLRAKYSGIMLDVAWSLFEIRVHRNPGRSPNEIWAELTRDYLKIVPHPEWSWWAMRGQLVDGPGYMLNYAFGAILVADLRAALTSRRGRLSIGDTGWYGWVAPRLYRFGAERPARDVVRAFLGRPVGTGALLTDLARGNR